MANINITTEELQKVLKGTEISEKHFMARLSNIKMEDYKSNKENPGAKKEKKEKEEKEMVIV